jgi:DNA-binding LytR/AlgR family response regulator
VSDVFREYRIAICDDEEFTCTSLEGMIRDILMENSLKTKVDLFFLGRDLKRELDSGTVYDFIFLDIELGDISGVDIGKYLREAVSDVRTQIVFISSKTQYAMELFQVQPLDFLAKPISRESIDKTLKRGLKIIGTLQDHFEYAAGNSMVRIPYFRIQYFESVGRRIRIVTNENDIWFYGKLSHVNEKLPDTFIRIHKSYIVNYNAVMEFKYDRVTLIDHTELSISRPYRDEIRRCLMKRMEKP